LKIFKHYKYMFSFKDQTVIVTGGAAGIGRATVRAFADLGAHVECWDVNEALGQALVSELAASGQSATFTTVNVTQLDDVQAAVADAVSRTGRVDVLINNAGITKAVSYTHLRAPRDRTRSRMPSSACKKKQQKT